MTKLSSQLGVSIFERGIEGWYQAVEVIDPNDGLRVGGTLEWMSMTWRIASIAKRLKPLHGGIVILLKGKSNEQSAAGTSARPDNESYFVAGRDGEPPSPDRPERTFPWEIRARKRKADQARNRAAARRAASVVMP